MPHWGLEGKGMLEGFINNIKSQRVKHLSDRLIYLK